VMRNSWPFEAVMALLFAVCVLVAVVLLTT
jgi:hypothetical protein